MSDKPFMAAMVVPTGLGARIGGHAGDATAAARLLAEACDTLLLHPNVVNAADLNEMPGNALYVEGSMLDRLLEGEIGLAPTRENSIVLACNEAIPETVNCAASAASLLRMRIRVVTLDRPLAMISAIDQSGVAGGTVDGLDEAAVQLNADPADAVALHTPVDVDRAIALDYMRRLDGPNPWGGVEAKVSGALSRALGRPVAHAPVETNTDFNEVVPRAIAPELISASMLFSVLKGLRRAPRMTAADAPGAIGAGDIDALVTADCWGPPHEACRRQGIPIIRVTTNRTAAPMTAAEARRVHDAATYAEAAGLLLALRGGMSDVLAQGRV